MNDLYKREKLPAGGHFGEEISFEHLPNDGIVHICRNIRTHSMPETESIITGVGSVTYLIDLSRRTKLINVPIRCRKIEEDERFKWKMTDTAGRIWFWQPGRSATFEDPAQPNSLFRANLYWVRIGSDDDPSAPYYELTAIQDKIAPYQRWILSPQSMIDYS